MLSTTPPTTSVQSNIEDLPKVIRPLVDQRSTPTFTSAISKSDLYDTEVLQPLYKKQEEKRAAEEKACTDKGGTIENGNCKFPPPLFTDPNDPFVRLKQCESGGDYETNTGNGYYGAYQYDLRTWNNYRGYERPDLAPANVQDAKAQETHSERGWSAWPACSRKLGLSNQSIIISESISSVSVGSVGGPNGYALGQCTWYVKTRRPDIGGYWGNASQWLYSAQSAGYVTGSSPIVGAVAVLRDGNHVAFVEGIKGDEIYISEMNFYGYGGGLGIKSFRWASASGFLYIY